MIDPADGRAFVRLSVIGVAIQWVVGMAALLRGPVETFDDVAMALGPWWTGVALPALWWPGFLMVCFAFGAWARRRWPRFAAWTPRPTERDQVSRFAYLVAVAGMAFGIAILLDPARLLDLFSDAFLDGRMAPVAYDSLTYDPAFLHLRGPLLLALQIAHALLFAAVGGRGRWTATTRRLDLAIQVALVAVMTWVALDGKILVGEASDSAVKGILSLIVVMTVIGLIKRIVRERARLRPLTALFGGLL